jgi:hypothetical protein
MADRDDQVLRAAAEAALQLLETYGPDDDQEDEEFVAVRADLRAALKTETRDG